MVDPDNHSTKEDDEDYLEHTSYKEFAKKALSELKEKFENHHSIKRKLSDDEFREMYEDYRDSGLAFNDYMKTRKFR
jgi:hypothetical protein